MDRKKLVTLTNLCMITKGDEILVIDRQKKDWPGITFPGGHVENDESIVDSVIREVKEETGLDIQTRKSIWDLLYQLQREEGMTVVLTTHYLDEADEADQIYIVDHGKVIAQGSALDIKSQYARNILKIRFKEMQQIESLKTSGMSVERQGPLEYVFQPESERQAIDYLAQVGDRIAHFEFRPGTMDDAFIALTGREVR